MIPCGGICFSTKELIEAAPAKVNVGTLTWLLFKACWNWSNAVWAVCWGLGSKLASLSVYRYSILVGFEHVPSTDLGAVWFESVFNIFLVSELLTQSEIFVLPLK